MPARTDEPRNLESARGVTMSENSNSGSNWMNQPGMASGALTRINQYVLDCIAYRIWISMATGEGVRSVPIVRRLWRTRLDRSQRNEGSSTSRAGDEVVFGASREGAVVGTIAVRIDSPAGLRA